MSTRLPLRLETSPDLVDRAYRALLANSRRRLSLTNVGCRRAGEVQAPRG